MYTQTQSKVAFEEATVFYSGKQIHSEGFTVFQLDPHTHLLGRVDTDTCETCENWSKGRFDGRFDSKQEGEKGNVSHMLYFASM